jgi:nitrate/TMAO reductase-like tetraheme cytochrome c subunit
VLIAHEAMADGQRFRADNARWKAECGSCHLAYPPQLLSAPAWRRIMAGLDRHFGTDASLDPAAAAEIGAFLENNSGRNRRERAPTLRITDSAWFRHEHDEVPAAAWRRPSVTSAANCAACHRAAGQSDFRERNIRIPR